jgi:hypothetical protein
MSQKPPRRTLSDILKANEMIGKKEENEKKKGKSGRWTRRKPTGKSLSQLLKEDANNKRKGKKVNNRWTRKKQPPIHNPITGWEVDDLFAPMPGMTLSEEYRLNHRGDKEKSNSPNVNSKEFLDDDQLKRTDEVIKDAMDGIGKKKKRPRKRRKKAKKSKKQTRKKKRRISRKRGKT